MPNARNVAWGGAGGDGSGVLVGSGPQGQPVQNVKLYGAAGDGITDDTVAIQAAIQAAGTLNGGVVFLPAGIYKISSTLTIGNASGTSSSTYNGVVLQGDGKGGNLDGLGSPTTKLLWAGSSGGDVVKINGPIAGWGLKAMQIDGGAGGAARGIHVVSGEFGTATDLQVQNCTDAIYTETLTGGGHNTMHNYWRDIDLYVGIAANCHGIFIDGSPDNLSNTSFDVFENVYIIFLASGNTGYGIYLKRCDTIGFTSVHFAAVTASKKCLTFDYTGNSSWPGGCVIERVDFATSTATVQNVGSPSAALGLNRVKSVSSGNGRVADPKLAKLVFGDVVLGTASLTWPGGSSTSNALSVPHGLGAVPTTVVANVGAYSGVSVAPVTEVLNSFNDATNIALRAQTVDGNTPLNTATTTVNWMAYG